MEGLRDLPAEQQVQLCAAFAAARQLHGSRAAFAREADVDTTTVQTLEGKRGGPVSADMINRLTTALGWPSGAWRRIAAGEIQPPQVVRVKADQPRDISRFTMAELLDEIAHRTGADNPSSKPSS